MGPTFLVLTMCFSFGRGPLLGSNMCLWSCDLIGLISGEAQYILGPTIYIYIKSEGKAHLQEAQPYTQSWRVVPTLKFCKLGSIFKSRCLNVSFRVVPLFRPWHKYGSMAEPKMKEWESTYHNWWDLNIMQCMWKKTRRVTWISSQTFISYCFFFLFFFQWRIPHSSSCIQASNPISIWKGCKR